MQAYGALKQGMVGQVHPAGFDGSYEAQWRATIAAANGNAGTDESQLSASDQAAPSSYNFV